jgi:hypothetical protein
MTTCPICGAKSRDGLMCTACWQQLARDLRAIPDLLADLDTAAAKQARLTPPAPGGLASERNNVDWDARDTLHALTNTLIHWANTLGGQPVYFATTAATRLSTRAPEVRAHPQSAALWHETTSAIHRARAEIDRKDRHIDIGDCPKPDCGGTLRAYLPAADDRPTTIGCLTDPTHVWSPDQWSRLGRILNAQAR